MYHETLKYQNDTDLINTYRNYGNHLTALIDKTKNHYYKSIIEDNKDNPSTVWTSVNSFIGISKVKQPRINELILEYSLTIADRNLIAIPGNKHFVKMGKNQASKITYTNLLIEGHNGKIMIPCLYLQWQKPKLKILFHHVKIIKVQDQMVCLQKYSKKWLTSSEHL